jgi:CRP/FNR family transcriptional regulator, cyclic AMP receptor protein
MASPDKPDDFLAMYRPDILPLSSPDKADVVDAQAVPSTDPRIEHLRRVSLFSECTDQELRRIAGISKIIETPAGTVVTQIGTPGDSFFFIIDGRVSVQTPVGTGDMLTPGDFFGEMSLLDGEPRSATVTAVTDLRLLVVERSHFWRLLKETPDLVARILVVLSRRVRRLEQAGQAMLHRMNLT